MAEFNIATFSKDLYELFLSSSYFPKMESDYLSSWGTRQSDSAKHPNRSPLHLQEAARKCVEQTFQSIEENIYTFDYGNEEMEISHPYYHILENTPYIRKANRSTEKSRGSQAKIEDVGKRNYENVSWNGKTFTKEYRRNIRGSRKRTDKVSHWAYGNNFKVFVNREANSYLNEHYQYIETIVDSIIYMLAEQNGVRFVAKSNSGLMEDYLSDFEQIPSSLSNDILETFYSFD